MENDFYVYEWYNIDNGEVFYVGKGRKNRYKSVHQRNKYFKNYLNKNNCSVRKIKEKISQDEAFELEIKLISEYKKVGQCKTNLTTGGEGCRFEEGSWNDLFRKLQYAYCVRKTTRVMGEDEEDCNPKNLKNATLEELEILYEDYLNALEGQWTYNSIVNDEGWEHVFDD